VSLVRLRAAIWMTNHPPSVLWHCWLGHQTCKNVPGMSYIVSSATLNLSQPVKLSYFVFCMQYVGLEMSKCNGKQCSVWSDSLMWWCLVVQRLTSCQGIEIWSGKSHRKDVRSLRKSRSVRKNYQINKSANTLSYFFLSRWFEAFVTGEGSRVGLWSPQCNIWSGWVLTYKSGYSDIIAT